MDYDVIKEQIDTAIENLDPAISTADGTVVSLVVAGAAVPIAGCYGYAESVARKPFPDQCNKSDLFHHAVLKEIPFTTDIEEDVLREKVLSAWNYPPTGGGESDWDTLAASVCSLYSEKRFCVRDIWEARGLGTVDVAIWPLWLVASKPPSKWCIFLLPRSLFHR